ncbi:MAG: hypothetical protein ABW004_10670, partial [Aeromicrobium sp.]
MPDSCTCSCATTRRRRRPTATLVIASLALFMSLGGTSYAAVKAKSIGNKQLKNNAVTSGKIARNGVTASDIRAAVIDGTKIKAGAIDGTKIKAGSITSKHILDRSIGAQDIQPGSIGAGQIAANSLNAQQIADQSLGLGELNQATVDLFKDVPVSWVVDGAPDSDPTPTVSTDAFTTMRSYSVPASGTGKTGTTLVQSQVSVYTGASQTSTVDCYVYVATDPAGAGLEIPAGIKATSTSTVAGRVVIPVTALVHLSEGIVVQTRCRATGVSVVKAEITNLTGATSMTL